MSGSTPGRDIGLDGQGRHAVAPPDQRIVPASYSNVANWLSGTVRPFGSGMQLTKRRKRKALLVGRAHDDIDEIDVVANLRDGAARNDGVEHVRESLRA